MNHEINQPKSKLNQLILAGAIVPLPGLLCHSLLQMNAPAQIMVPYVSLFACLAILSLVSLSRKRATRQLTPSGVRERIASLEVSFV